MPASSSWQVTIDGNQLSTADMGKLDLGVVEGNLNMPDACTLTFHNPDPKSGIIESTNVKIGSTLDITISAGTSTTKLFSGEVVALEAEIDNATHKSSSHIIRAFDAGHRLHRGTDTKAWLQKAYSDVVTDIANSNNLTGGQIDDTGSPVEYIAQFNTSDWDFLQYVASKSKYNVTILEGQLNFNAPDGASGGGGETLQIDGNADLVYLRAMVTSSQQVSTVEFRGWDPIQAQAVTSTSTPATQVATGLPDSPGSMASAFGTNTRVMTFPPLTTAADAQNAADSVGGVLAGAFVDLDGVANGNAALKPGATVTLVNIGAKFDGQYVLSSVRHRYEKSHYTTGFQVSGSQDRSFISLMQGGDGRQTIPGVVQAIVTDIKDPNMNIGRVRVKFPWLDDTYQSDWARVVIPGGGNNRGFVALPEVNDEVLVAFEQGDPTRPIVLGGLHNGQAATPSISNLLDTGMGVVNQRTWTSKKGHNITIDDQKDQIIVQNQDGSYAITIDQQGTKLTISAPQGDITITGKSITLQSTQSDITLTSTGNVSASATQSLSLSGTSGATLSSTASTTISAPQVSISMG